MWLEQQPERLSLDMDCMNKKFLYIYESDEEATLQATTK